MSWEARKHFIERLCFIQHVLSNMDTIFYPRSNLPTIQNAFQSRLICIVKKCIAVEFVGEIIS